ncbi:hypothetical protein [Tenacibaculum larymnensis]|uniref:Uncharacterized protein n=1 Tax=Tenacibaculum larymnensis TaxID=2878201 RepID=A0A9X4EQQ5_9FLAO|nr:hypothetical protein [Tenacibaculum larymnensis]MDE1207212.1 hypothetical protein [Tenacibaculum larymnensis]
MKIKILILFSFILISKSLFSQKYLNYYKIINIAEINSIDKNFLKADSIYQEAFSLVKSPFKEDYFLAAINSEKLGNPKKVYSYLKLSLEKGLLFKRIKTKDFKNFKKSIFWKKLKVERKQLEETYLSNINVSLRDEIHEMIEKDQKARRPIFGGWKQMKKVDSYNFNRFLKIIKENNNKWPGFSLIGENTPKGKYNVTGNITLMLLHFSKEQVEILKPYMLKAVLDGEMYPYHFARVIDYSGLKGGVKVIKKSNGKKIIEFCAFYGTYFNESICDCVEAEKERKKIGFEPLGDYYRKVSSSYTCKNRKL